MVKNNNPRKRSIQGVGISMNDRILDHRAGILGDDVSSLEFSSKVFVISEFRTINHPLFHIISAQIIATSHDVTVELRPNLLN